MWFASELKALQAHCVHFEVFPPGEERTTNSPGANVIKLFSSVIYEFLSQAREFVIIKSLQPDLKIKEIKSK